MKHNIPIRKPAAVEYSEPTITIVAPPSIAATPLANKGSEQHAYATDKSIR